MDYNLITLFPEVLSTSRDIELFSQCPYKWFVMRCQRISKYIYNNDLEAGREFAEAMEITRVAYYKSNLSQRQAIELGKKSILENFGATYAEAQYQDNLKTPEKLAEVFERMFEENPLDSDAIVPFEMADGSLSIEQDFSVELPFTHPETGKPLVLKCVLDMLGTKNNTVYVVDEKTTKSVLADSIKQTDLLRTQNQFVQYVTVANMNKEKFGGLEVTHVRINKCVIKKSYKKGEEVVQPYEFAVDIWFQKEWWNNLLYLVADMLSKYKQYKNIKKTILLCKVPERKAELEDTIIFPRAYGTACTTFFRPCSLSYHCTSGNAQDLFLEGYQQIVCDSRTKYEPISLFRYKRELLASLEK